MAKLSWSEVRDRAVRFSREWADATSEAADKQTFWNEFFEVFGITRKSVASFEAAVTKRSGHRGAIDLFWKSRLLVEHKSRGAHLSKAEGQAFDYVQALTSEGRHDEIPQYILLSDFDQISLFDLEEQDQQHVPSATAPLVFSLKDLHKQIHAFAFMLGQKPVRTDPQDPANERAYTLMCELHDELKAGGFGGTDLERLLVRILFCLFAEDTGIFGTEAFLNFLLDTREDGSDLGARLNELFYILDKPNEVRSPNLDAELKALPHVNGQLFKDPLGFPRFTAKMRAALIQCARFFWAKVSPVVFGSLFQGILEGNERRAKGAHYTSEEHILRLLRSLFLDDLRSELDRLKADRSTRRIAQLEAFHERLRKLRILDPACGAGSFLVLAYRELRALEIDVIRALTDDGKQQYIELRTLLKVDVDQFYGIEVDEWPARIAEVALWLMDHQMNLRASEVFGKYVERLPLTSSPNITIGNALRIDWRTVLPKESVSYIIGNPPFIGKRYRSPAQRQDHELVWKGVKGNGVLDYVTGWYLLAADYMRETNARAAFVSTSSITQGEQPAILFPELFKRGMTIQFAHRTFPWASEARGKASVHVVIIGFGPQRDVVKQIYDYDTADARGVVTIGVPNISPYLVAGGNFALPKRRSPLQSEVKEMNFGNMPNDGGHLLLDEDERAALVRSYPAAEKYIRQYVGPDEFLYSVRRYCLWLVNADPAALAKIPPIAERLRKVQELRAESTREETNRLASTPSLFGEIRQPSKTYLGVPKTTLEDRRYIPIAFFSPDVIASTDLFTVDGAGHYEFGVVSSTMHMAWVRAVCGRLESRYRYSSSIIYNNFPWPSNVSDVRRAAVENAAKEVESARAEFLPPKGESTIANLYDPTLMPPALAKAHAKLDRAVELCYRSPSGTDDAKTVRPFKSDLERVTFLLGLYETLTAPLVPKATAKAKRSKAKP